MSSKISITEKLSLVAIEKLTTAGTAWNRNRKGQLFRSKKKGSNFWGGPRVRIGKRRVERVHLSSRSPSPRCAHRLFFSPLRWYPACIETNRKETVRYVRAAPQKKVKRRKKKKKNVRKGTKKKKEGRKGKREGRTQYIVGGYLRRKRHEQQIDGRPPGPEWVLRGPRTATSFFLLSFFPRPRDFVPVAPHCPAEMRPNHRPA